MLVAWRGVVSLAAEAALRPRTRIPLLVRHRWVAELPWECWICLPRAAVLHPSISDPNCPGCRTVIAFADLPGWEHLGTPEAIQRRLDLLLCELLTKEGRQQYEKARQPLA